MLIHCFAGKSRASTITTQFLMKNMKLPLDKCLRHVKSCRPIALPNVGFVIQLKAYEKQLFGKLSPVPLNLEKFFANQSSDVVVDE